MVISEIRVPLLNANEPEALLVGIHAKDRQRVKIGQILFTIETTKATADIESPGEGYLRLIAMEGETVKLGDMLALITESEDEDIQEQIPVAIGDGEDGEKVAKKIRITKPAENLARSFGIDLSEFPAGPLITESVVRQFAGRTETISLEFIEKSTEGDKPRLLIFGAGGHAKSVIELVRQLQEYSIVGVVDDNVALKGKDLLGVPILGTSAILAQIYQKGVNLVANCVGGILNIQIRVDIFEMLAKAGFGFPALIHARAVVEPSAITGKGVQVFANAYIGAEAVLHPMCMVNTNAVVSHDCVIEEYTHIAPGALLAGHVHVGAKSLVGMGVTTAIGVSIGSHVRIGNGAIVLANVPDRTIIQAGRFWTGKSD